MLVGKDEILERNRAVGYDDSGKEDIFLFWNIFLMLNILK